MKNNESINSADLPDTNQILNELTEVLKTYNSYSNNFNEVSKLLEKTFPNLFEQKKALLKILFKRFKSFGRFFLTEQDKRELNNLLNTSYEFYKKDMEDYYGSLNRTIGNPSDTTEIIKNEIENFSRLINTIIKK